MTPLTRDTPYSFNNFLWLMKNSSAKSYLSDESVKKIDEALINKNEEPLRELYPVILEQFVSEREINIGFVLQQEGLLNEFMVKVEGMGYTIKKAASKRKKRIEDNEKKEAEKILKKID